MAQIGVLVTWREVTGTEPSTAQLQERLRPFQLEAVLIGFSRLAAVLETWKNEPSFATDQAFARQYLPSYYPAIRRLYETSTHRVTFTRIGILFVLKHACAVCQDDGRLVQTQADVETLLSCCLLANDLLLGRLPTRQDTAMEKAANLLPFTNYVPQDSYPTDLARNLVIVERIAPTLTERADYVDLAALFAEVTGVLPRRFCELTLATCTKFITNINQQLQDPTTALLLTPTFYEHIAISAEEVTAFLARLRTTPAELRAAVAQQAGPGSDFLLFQRRPLIAINGPAAVCPDPGFLMDKAGPGLYWTLHEATPAVRRHALLTYWCYLIERYVHWLFAQTYQGPGQFHPSPRFTDGAEAGDILLQEGSTLLLFEVKASILTVQAKYGFSPDVLADELQRKAITGEDGERKGVAQLRHTVTRWLDGTDIIGIDRERVRMIQPILVFLDRAFTSPYLNRVYNEHFNSPALRHQYRRIKMTPLFSITVDDVENLLPYTHAHRLTEILESYYRVNRGMYSTPSRSQIPLLQNATPGIDVVRQGFHAFADEMERRFFPQ
jgi:hypothetical protein